MRFSQRVAVITGGASGIGAATAKALAAEGARVVIADVNKESASQVVDDITAVGGTADFVATDGAVPADLEHLVEFTLRRHGRLDLLHTNHYWYERGTVGDISLDGFRRSLEVSLVSYWYATKLVLPSMVEAGRGAIVHTASVSGLAGDYGLGAYNVIKAGLINLTRVTAIDYARHGIRCNCVCPGPIQTPPIDRLRDAAPENWRQLRESIPMGRYGVADEVARAVLFLGSDDASFVTGAALVVDGGLSAHTGMPALAGQGPPVPTAVRPDGRESS